MTKTKRLALIIALTILGLVAIYYAMKWTTPKDCMVPINRMSQGRKDLIFPE